jgi:DNA-binding PadR family transcriptional regulator
MDQRILLLGLLRMQDMHGYQLNDFIDRRLDFVTDLKKPTAYYILNKLGKEGYVREETEQSGNRPERRVYHITESGERLFQNLLRENLASFEPTYYADDLGLLFIHSLAPQEVRAALEEKLARLREEIARLENLPAHSGPEDPVRLVLTHKLAHLRLDEQWISQIVTKLVESQNWSEAHIGNVLEECLAEK